MTKSLEKKIKIIHLTDREAVVFKPAGMATQLSNDIKGSSLEEILKIKFHQKNIFFPHRLDRITSGLILVAFDADTVNYYNNELKSNKFDKYYVCRVSPCNNNGLDQGKLIGTHKRNIKYDGNVSSIVKSGGKTSFLDILALEPAPKHKDCYHALIRLITGRMHQIRVMLTDIGIPLCGDHVYNPDSKDKKFYLESIALKFFDSKGQLQTIFTDCNPDRDIFSEYFMKRIESILA